MILYVDTSAVVKLHIEEPASGLARDVLSGSRWASAAHTYPEVRRAFWRALSGSALKRAGGVFEQQWRETDVVDVDEALCRRAAELIETTGVKTLDALHLSAAERAGTDGFATFDVKQAEAARALGLRVLPE